MALNLRAKPKKMANAGYSMRPELKKEIAEYAEKLEVSASALVVAVMEDYMQRHPLPRGKK